MILTPKNWHTFQHYNKRNPPWIKLHRALLDDYEFSQLPVESRALAPMLWLIASESKDGVINMSPEALAFRLRVDCISLANTLEPLMDKGFFLDASNVLADRQRHATPETETEAEKEAHPVGGNIKRTAKRERSDSADTRSSTTENPYSGAGFTVPEFEEAV